MIRHAHQQLYTLLSTTIVLYILCGKPSQGWTQQSFALELDLGRNIGLSSYKQNITYVEDSKVTDISSPEGRPMYQPYLANEQTNWGTYLGVRLLIDTLEVSLEGQWFVRDSILLHHIGKELLPRNRQRPDESYDDSGIDYNALNTERVKTLSTRNRGDLFVGSLSMGYRWYFYQDTFSAYVPIALGISTTHIGDPNQPYQFGIKANTGAGILYKFANNLALSAHGRLHGLLTLHYGNVSDAARRARQVNEGTEEALFSSMLQFSANVGVVFIVR